MNIRPPYYEANGNVKNEASTLFLFGSVAFMVQACKTMMIAFKTDIKHACIRSGLKTELSSISVKMVTLKHLIDDDKNLYEKFVKTQLFPNCLTVNHFNFTKFLKKFVKNATVDNLDLTRKKGTCTHHLRGYWIFIQRLRIK